MDNLKEILVLLMKEKTLIGDPSMHKHNLRSRLAEFQSRHTSSDTVGDERRHLMREIMEKNQPFDLTRPCVTDWEVKSSGSPFAGLTTDTMASFVSATREKFMLYYPDY